MRILIAEDDITSRLMLAASLKKMGHQVVIAEDGLQAWEMAQQEDAPKIAILDWMMPKLDGIEVCKRIRTLPSPYRYVIMQTSKSDKADIEEGYTIGADDYLTKPLDPMVLRHKINAAERVLNYEAKIETYAKEMENIAKERAKQLIHADRMATLGMLSAGVAHEINNPLTFISGNAQTIEKAWKMVNKHLSTQDADVLDQFAFIMHEVPSMLSGVHNGVARISKIVSGLKRFARQEPLKKASFSISQAVTNSIEFCGSKLRKGIQVETKLTESTVFGDMQQIEQVLINFIMNAADAMVNQRDAKLIIHTWHDPKWVHVSIQDNGPGLPEKLLTALINPFFTTKAEGTGLGLSISHGIITEHGGLLRACNNADRGARFQFALPIATNSTTDLP